MIVTHGVGLCLPWWGNQQSTFCQDSLASQGASMMQTILLKCHYFLAPDIDECHTANTCHQNATCNNTKGSYNCTCNEGFKGDGRINCTGKVLLKSIPNHKSQNGTFLSSKTELPATFEFARLTTQEFSVSSFDSLSTLPIKASSFLYIDELQIRVPLIN